MGVCDSLKDIGKYQWTCIVLSSVTSGWFVFANVVILLIAPRIDFQCSDTSPIFQNLSSERQRELMYSGDQCYRPDIDFQNLTETDLDNLNVSTTETRQCDHFTYDKTIFKLTVTEKFNLVCEREWLLSFAKTIFMAGHLVGSMTYGSLADRFGRKIVMVVSGILCTLWHLLCGFAPTVELFLLGRFLLATCCIAYYYSGLVLHTELMRSDQRKVPRAGLSFSMGITGVAFTGTAFVIQDFRYLQTLLAALAFVSSVAVWILIPESPRWLCAQQRSKEAQAIVHRIAKFNKWEPEKLSYLLQTTHSEDDSTKTTLLDLYRTPLLRKRSFILASLWFCQILAMYSLVYNLDRFWPDVRVSMMISDAMEMPLLCIPWLTIDYFGRQFMTSFFLITSGICCLCMVPFVSVRGSPWLLVFALTGKLLAASQYFIGTVFTQELYPTNVRTQGVGMSVTVSRIAGMLAPQVSLLDKFWPALSVTLVGLLAIFGGLLAPTLPDTTGCELPVTLEDGERHFKDHRYQVQIACLRKRNAAELAQPCMAELPGHGNDHGSNQVHDA